MFDDRFRKRYVKLDDIQKALISDIKDQAAELESLIDRIDKEYDVRCAYLAYSKLEEAIMWAVKGCSVDPEDA